MKIIIPGGSGHVGAAIKRHFSKLGHDVVVLSRSPKSGEIEWDGVNLGPWATSFEGADVVINLAGRTVNCRYNQANLDQMMQSRVLSTKVVGEAIRVATNPPKVWLQSSTATIYKHRFDAANDEVTGILGGDEPGAPYKWNASIAIAKAWEAELDAAETPHTRKVALRSAMTMTVDKGSVFDVFATLAKRGLGGRLGSGKQFVSWIHEIDFAQALDFLIRRNDIAGAVNICSPNPLPQSEFARLLRQSVSAPFGLPASSWMVELGTWAMRTESELVLKSRRVVPGRLLDFGFQFQYPLWQDASRELYQRMTS
jgi:uncharacterized protein